MKFKAVLRSPVIFALSLLAYLLVARDLVYEPSIAPYFINLAEAFLRGSASIDMDITSQYDLIYYEQQWCMAQLPLPGMLLAPFTLWFDHPSDIMLGVLIGALSLMVSERVLRAAVPNLSWWRRMALVAFFGFGTVHLYLSTMGTVWFLGQTSAVLAFWLFLAMVIARRPM